MNPFRYRGYYYDVETGFYYLQSRYYDAGIGRFLNADGLISTDAGLLGYNMFIYCNNNPIIYKDISGQSPIKSFGTKVALGIANILETLTTIHENNIKLSKSKPNFVPNPNKRKGSEKRQPSGDRERNVGHPNGEEHSRVPKGNRGIRKAEALKEIIFTTVLMTAIIVDDLSLAGAADNVALAPTAVIWWDNMTKLLY